MKNRDLRSALLTALAVVVVLFPDALFMGAGLSQTSQFMGTFEKKARACFYPQPPHRSFHHAYADNGGALWQSEPAQQFLRRCLKFRESPYWNPYSGAGQLGPETLVDLKFSFQALLVALLGGSQTAFNAVIIGSFFVAVTFLYLFFVRYLKLASVSAVGACFVFALNGYCTATQGSNTSQTYLYFPVLLYFLTSFAIKPTTIRFLAIFAIDLIVLSTTFFPTTFLSLCTTHVIALAASLSREAEGAGASVRRILLVALLQIGVALLALMGLGFLYLPIIESFQHIDAISMYSQRIFFHANICSLLSLFSSKHFWEEYQAIPAILYSAAPENHGITITNSVYHFGAAAWTATVCSLNAKTRKNPVSIVCAAMLALSLGRIFGFPVISQIVELTPGFRSLGEQYWFITAAISFTVSSALGLDAINNRVSKAWIAPIAVAATVFGAIAYLNFTYGFVTPDIAYKQTCVLAIVIFTFLTIALIGLAFRFERYAAACSVALVIVITSELLFDTMFFRTVKYEYYRAPPAAVHFLRSISGLYRVLNLNKGAVPPEEGSAFGIQQIETLNMNILPSYEKFFHKHFVADRVQNWGRFCTLFAMVETGDPKWKDHLNMPMLSLCGVKYILVSPFWPKTIKTLKNYGCKRVFPFAPWQIFENTRVYPRAFLTEAVANTDYLCENADDRARSVAFTKDQMLIEDCERLKIPAAQLNGALAQSFPQAVTIAEYHNDKVVINTQANKATVLILTDNWHPNWKARLDGQPVHLGLVDETFRGVAVPSGSHKIEMSYRPSTLTAGIALSGLALIIAATLLLMRKRVDVLMSRL